MAVTVAGGDRRSYQRGRCRTIPRAAREAALQTEPTLLLTRPEAQSRAFAEACRDGGAWDRPVVISPVLRIVPRPAPELAGRVPVFTSQNAVTALGAGSGPAWAVGRRTAEAAREAGFACREGGGDVAVLAQRILAEAPSARLIHLRGAHVTGSLAETLRASGLGIDEAVVYDQEPQELTEEATEALTRSACVVLPLFSPRSARLLAERLPASPAPLEVLALSAAVAAAWWAGPARIVARPDAEAMIAAISDLRRGGLVAPGCYG